MLVALLRSILVIGAVLVVPVTAAFGQAPAPRPFCGTKPSFDATPYSSFTGQVAIATNWASSIGPSPLNNRSVIIWDLTAQAGAPLNVVWNGQSNPPTQPFSHPQWDVGRLGDVFGVTLDKNGDIYVAATRIYPGSAKNGSLAKPGTALQQAGQVYKIANPSGVPASFGPLLPNDGNGLGNIHYDDVHDSLYVSNFHDGLIYRMTMNGVPQPGPWNHGANLSTATNLAGASLGRANIVDPPGASYTARGRRPWAVRVRGNRLYYSVWNNNPNTAPLTTGLSEIWSVGLNANGDPIAPARLELTLPPSSTGGTTSQPVADIAFSSAGTMVVAERTMIADNASGAHGSRVLEFKLTGNVWTLLAPPYEVGTFNHTNAAGGADFDFGPGGRLWVTGDALHFATNDRIYGLQGFRPGGVDLATSILIDLNDDATNVNKYQVGSVRIPCPQEGRLKICKVAGPGVAVGTPVTFTVGPNQQPVTVPAGPAPGGTCVVVEPSFPVHSHVTIVETPTAGNTVSGISVEPSGHVLSQNLAGGAVTVDIGAGVTEVTYTDKKTGYLEICKRSIPPSVTGTFQFYVNGTLGPFNVPTGACSPAIQVPAGQATITEMPKPLTVVVDCSTIPASHLVGCTGSTATVTVDAGDISQQTIVFMTNRRIHFPFPTSGDTSSPTFDVPPGPGGAESPAK